MIGLVPREYWEHKFGDLVYSLAGALLSKKQRNTLQIEGLGSCIPIRSGRAGIVVAIKALNIPPGARIGVPLYCCPVVFKAVTAAGCTVRFIDIDHSTFCMSTRDLRAKNSQLDAVLAVHMFGNLCDITGLQVAAQGKPIIEDCAQALGSRRQGRMAGSFGTISFFSFRSGKYLSVGEGGALFSDNKEILSRASRIIDKMTTQNYANECTHAIKAYAKSILRSKPLYGIIGYPLWKFVNKKMKLSEASAVVLSQIYLSDYTITRKRLPLLNSALKRQRANADYYSEALELDAGMLCSEQPDTLSNRYHYPVIFPSMEHRDHIAAYLLNQKVDTIKYLDDVVDIASEHYGYTGDCPISAQLSKRVLIIPSYYGLNRREVQYIAKCLNEGWAEVKKRNYNIFV